MHESKRLRDFMDLIGAKFVLGGLEADRVFDIMELRNAQDETRSDMPVNS